MSNTSNLVLPYLAVGQAQKHVTVNESLRRLDAIVQLSVVSATITAQPATPADGAVYIVPPGKSGDDWSAYANGSLAYYRDGAWEQVSPREGWLAYVRDADEIRTFNGSAWDDLAVTLGAWRVLAAGATPVSHSGDTFETALASITLPGGRMGPNGVLRITAVFSHTNSGNSKVLRYRLGGSGVSGSAMMGITTSSTTSVMTQRLIQNRNSEASQVAGPSGIASSFGASNNAPATAAIDTSVDQAIVLSCVLADSGETITLESWLVEVAHGA